MKQQNKISALIITYNEMGYIEKCIESIAFADEIIVVDSYSTDGTYEFLVEHPKVKVIQHPFSNFTAQKAFTLKQAANDWVLFLDADEVVSKKLKTEITTTVNSNNTKEAYWFYRKFMFQNKALNYSGWQTDKNYRLFRKSKATFCNKRIVHETLNIDGATGKLKNKLDHYCYKNYSVYKNKVKLYGQLKALEAFNKNRKFNYLLLAIKPSWKFLFNYFIRLGILDGKKGLTICYLDALGEVERYQKLRQLEVESRQLSNIQIKALSK
ncbi:glycosyltransferase family 2 protein [uncultured Maribacter sp.]|uniref:glycosyltransferase family 2 protein n=1 Tax=uncultured Maribacter sp. TaxID=431308 RepID=UPI002622BF2B|nr:glycosyltransferase family 2 protein [uncultured Maribacter sp.]